MKKYLVTLAQEERAALGQRVRSGRGSARELTRARILLKADCGPDGPGWTDGAIAALDVSVSTVERMRKRFAAAGREAALRPRREYRRKLVGEQEAHLLALVTDPLGSILRCRRRVTGQTVSRFPQALKGRARRGQRRGRRGIGRVAGLVVRFGQDVQLAPTGRQRSHLRQGPLVLTRCLIEGTAPTEPGSKT
jgi:hypothetical protein